MDVLPGIRWGAILYADNLEDIETILGTDLLEKRRKKFMKTIKGIVYERKTPDMDWDIEKDIENQIASMKVEFAEEHGEETLKKYIELNKDRYITKNLDDNKEEIASKYLSDNKDKIKEEYFKQLSSETREQDTILFIKNMLKENLPLKSIAKISNKSLKEIKEISKI